MSGSLSNSCYKVHYIGDGSKTALLLCKGEKNPVLVYEPIMYWLSALTNLSFVLQLELLPRLEKSTPSDLRISQHSGVRNGKPPVSCKECFEGFQWSMEEPVPEM